VHIFYRTLTWWHGTTWGTWLYTLLFGKYVGDDAEGNKYYQSTDNKRWVQYKGIVEASRIDPDWHAWLHYLTDNSPKESQEKRQAWEQPHQPNLTGTSEAIVPPGSTRREGKRHAARGDYEAWSPGEQDAQPSD